MKTPLLLAIVALLPGSAALSAAADAPALWAHHCAKCHGPEGKGDTNMGKKLKIRDYTDPAVQAQFTDEDVVQAINDGVKDENGKTRMKAIEGLSPEDTTALVRYVRGLKK
ncbi:MAG TPA: cytochrome c [Opitutaceae bacterium]